MHSPLCMRCITQDDGIEIDDEALQEDEVRICRCCQG